MTSKKHKRTAKKYKEFTLRGRKIFVLLDKVLVFRYIQRLHGRFWGVAGLFGMLTGFGVCFIIRPDLMSWSTAFSDFGSDVRTAPYFSGALFFAAYGLWRWRNYLRRTVLHFRPILSLLTLTIIGLYLIVFMPLTWNDISYRLHLTGVSIVGASIVLTVVLDGLFSKTRKGKNRASWRAARFISFWAIVFGGWITIGSIEEIGLYDSSGLGELLMIGGYGLWIIIKTYHGDGGRTTLSKMLNSLVQVKN